MMNSLDNAGLHVYQTVCWVPLMSAALNSPACRVASSVVPAWLNEPAPTPIALAKLSFAGGLSNLIVSDVVPSSPFPSRAIL